MLHTAAPCQAPSSHVPGLPLCGQRPERGKERGCRGPKISPATLSRCGEDAPLAAAHNAQLLPCCVWYRQSGQRQCRSVAAPAHNHHFIPADGPIKRNDHQTVQVGSKAALPSPLVLDEPDLATRGVISFPYGASSGARP